MPQGFSGNVQIKSSTITIPLTINEHFKKIGGAYDINISGNPGPISFGADFAVISYAFDKDRLKSQGFLEDFMVFYFDTASSTWKRVDKLEVDYSASKIIAYTSHFTTFVATAALSQPTSIPAPPTGIAADYPAGIGGTGGAVFTVVGEGYQYYQDRAYYVKPLYSSTINQTTFNALGFEGAMGIATMNGGTVANPSSAHKLFTGDNYINFVAKRDLDVYVLYDTRGGAGPTDNSADAPWLSAKGFTPTGYFIETTDAVGSYKIYKKTYLNGSTISLDGNRKAVADPGINTNYWVILKRAGVLTPEPASAIVVSPVDIAPPGEVQGLTAAGGDRGVRLSWTPPSDSDFKEVRISYSPGGSNPYILPAGNQTADFSSLTNGTIYTFTVKTVDNNLNISNGVSVNVVPNLALKAQYFGNGNTSGNAPTDNLNYVSGQAVTIAGNTGLLVKTGYNFSGWNSQPDGKGTNYNPGQSTNMGLTNLMLYAKWVPAGSVSVDVTLDLGDEDIVTTIVPGTVIRGSLLTVSVAESFANYQWYLDSGVGIVGSGQSIDIDTSNLVPGLHTLMVLVSKNGVYTSHTCQFTLGNPSGLTVSYSVDLGSEETISLSIPGTIVRGSNMLVGLSQSFDTYQWYLDDGSQYIGSGSNVTVNTATLLPGFHNLLIVVSKNGVFTSKTCRFTIGNASGLTIGYTLSVGTEVLVSTQVPLTVQKASQLNISVDQDFDSYAWYLDDGATLISNLKSASVSTHGFSVGLHNLVLVVSKNGEATSVSYRIAIVN